MKETNHATEQTRQDRAPTWSFWLWLAAAVLVVIIVAVIGTAWAVRNAIVRGDSFWNAPPIFTALFQFPELVRSAVQEFESSISGDPLPLLIDRKSTEQQHWIRRFPAAEDAGYLLFSGVDPALKRSVVQLIRISDGTPVAHWEPDWTTIYEKITPKMYVSVGSPIAAQASHPLLLADGDIIFNVNMTAVRLTPCNSRPVWVLDEVVHHSLELDASGAGIWAPSYSHEGYADTPWLQNRIRDDALAHISTDGRMLENRSFTRILRDNGLQAMLLGRFGQTFNKDPIHINHIRVASRNTKYWQKDDLLISARNLSTLFLYRPSTNKIIWYQTGPWMNQHSVDFVDDHQISVLDNNVVFLEPKEHAFLSPDDINHVILYDFDTKRTSQPFEELLKKARPVTISEGVARVLPDGGLFFEETNYGRHLRFTRDHLLWSRVNDYDDQRIGAVSWSRYLTAEEVRIPLQALSSRKCSAVTSR